MRPIAAVAATAATSRPQQRCSSSAISAGRHALPTPSLTSSSSSSRTSPAAAPHNRHRRDVSARALLEPSQALGVALFFTPGLLGLVYAYFKGKGNIKDGLSRMLTEFSKGYFQPDVGGKNIPVAQGELSDLAGDEPLFKALYQW